MRSLKTQKAEELKNEISTYYSQEQLLDFAYDKRFQFQNRIIQLEKDVIMTVPENVNLFQYYQELVFNLSLVIDLVETLTKSYRNFIHIHFKKN
jgi:hypothetical protein